MVQKYYADSGTGDYLGSFDGDAGDNPFTGHTDTGVAPGAPTDNWNGSSWDANLSTATTAQLKAEANRRIAKSGHDWMAARETGGGATMPSNITTYASDIRADCVTLEASPPTDWTNDTHWTADP